MTYNAVNRLPLMIHGNTSRVHMAGPHTALTPTAALLNEASPFFPDLRSFKNIDIILYHIFRVCKVFF